jgi:hypothetical protein
MITVASADGVERLIGGRLIVVTEAAGKPARKDTPALSLVGIIRV